MNRSMTSRRGHRGFTLIEIVTVLGVASVLSSLAWPSFQGSLQKARRAEAMLAMAQLQIAQERWYANRGRYGSLEELRLSARTRAGHYQRAIVDLIEALPHRIIHLEHGQVTDKLPVAASRLGGPHGAR